MGEVDRDAIRSILGADVAGVEAAGDADILGAFDDGAAIGEQGEFVGIEEEAKGELVAADGAEGGEAFGEGGEVERAVAFVDLDGVASAEADGGATGAVEIDELAAAAGGASERIRIVSTAPAEE